MFDFNRNQLANATASVLKKQRTFIWCVSIVLLIAGILCLINPIGSGFAISMIIGIFIIASGITVIGWSFTSSIYSGWNKLFSLLVGIAYLILGYIFVTDPAQGLLSLAIFISILFLFGGFIRIYLGIKQLSNANGWLHIIIGLLDLVIAYLLVGNGPVTSITLLTTLVGIELLFSSFSLMSVATLLKRRN